MAGALVDRLVQAVGRGVGLGGDCLIDEPLEGCHVGGRLAVAEDLGLLEGTGWQRSPPGW